NRRVKEDKRITQNDIDQTHVRLKPIFGIQPESYLPALYGLAALALLFFVFVLPGIKNNGSLIRFTADPPGSAVYVDGVYKGATPCTVFVSSGERSLAIGYPGFSEHSKQLTVGGRLIGSLFLPRRLSIHAVLAAQEPLQSLLTSGMQDFASWALAGQPSEAYQIPMVLSDAARAWSCAAFGPDGAFLGPAAPGFATSALSYAGHAVSARDAVRAIAIVDTASAALSPLGLGRIAAAVKANPQLLQAIAARLSPESRSALEATTLYRSMQTVPQKTPPKTTGIVSYAGRKFVGIEGDADTAPFFLAQRETTIGEFKAFLEKNPAWADSSALQAQALADENYLSGLANAADGESMRWVSRFAAQAYCDWLSAQAPSGYRFALPSEAQWSRAAAASIASGDSRRYAVLMESGRSGPDLASAMPEDGAGFQGLLGGVWEWTMDSYSFLPELGAEARSAYPSAEAAVRGASWANQPGSVDLSSRGPFPARSASAYLGFRIAMVKQD
ncbi:MAG TPA: SUMF1/EgtB/PvdO family nonheme iron enzyme, partial [Spirochaetales bacterium]|nr:SUMF1/EgtB/PvdO family nonheme iron enzyme [Spirochaetales bacterium]